MTRDHHIVAVHSERALIKSTDMEAQMQHDAIEMCLAAMHEFDQERDIAAALKKEFDKKYFPTWHCFVGTQFGSYVSHEKGNFIYFVMLERGVLLFKAVKTEYN
ncbi:hypothetical protein EG68_01074 [Paragonimus skrjabini miyazakii]|uniref:Dynein light chain n=1 Tax=Paragonimus skrjabini miyazakii TaxID=59628 RepID=A0A8S9Z2S1_9TREM|nr:hypothetical protein EG68_01074 [Paragonimus skrjabini miyazakii]